jgi:hypothetical protein
MLVYVLVYYACFGVPAQAIKKNGSRGGVRFVLKIRQYYIDEVKAAALKSCAGRPSASSGASLDFALTSYTSLLGVVYIKGGSFYYLNSPL